MRSSWKDHANIVARTNDQKCIVFVQFAMLKRQGPQAHLLEQWLYACSFRPFEKEEYHQETKMQGQ